MSDKKKYKTEYQEKLPPDYQAHIDGENESLTEKMKRLQNEWSIVYHKIMNKPLF